jgi:PAS domain S-box-containing protein
VFLGEKVWELGFFKDVVTNEANFAELQEKKYIRYEDMALEGHDGKRHEVEFVSNVYLVDGGKVIQCNIRDISERKQAEAVLAVLAVLAETKAILQAALDHSQAGIAIADAPSGKLRYVNRAGLLIGGGTQAELVAGVDANQYVASWNLLNLDGTALAKEEVPLTRAILFGEQNTREFIISPSELDGRIVLANAAPIRNPAGEITAAIVVFLDITEQKRAEELLRQNAQELRARNEELSRFNRLMTGRELCVIELKQQVNELAAQLGQPWPYPLAFLDAAAAEVVRTATKPSEQNSKNPETPKGTSL